MDKKIYNQYLNCLRKELMIALGCTEPIAIAYASSLARAQLNEFPKEIIVFCSGNVIKNAKDVVVPNSGKQKGIAVAAVLGALGGDPDKKLGVLSGITSDKILQSQTLVSNGACHVKYEENESNLYIRIEMKDQHDSVMVEIKDKHTNVVRIVKNGKCLLDKTSCMQESMSNDFPVFMSIDGILDFAESVNIKDIQELLESQVHLNRRVGEEGLKNDYGANVGKNILKLYGDDRVEVRAKAYAAAASDARMGGCSLPVVINSGSGNQGITVSIPVFQYAEYLNSPEDKLYRALAISNLVAIYLKSGIGPLSAFCGAVSAATGSGAAIAYLLGLTRSQIAMAITNTLGTTSGIICDGAKASCAAKIATAIDAAISGVYMAMQNDCFKYNEGILGDDLEGTIKNISRLGRDGMARTDVEILRIMVG